MKKASEFEIGFIKIPIELIDHDKENYKDGIDLETGEIDYESISGKALNGSIKKNGQLLNIVVKVKDDDRFMCVDGNHRLPALRKAGIFEVWAYNLGNVTDSQAKLISLELNENRFGNNQEMFRKRLEDIMIEIPMNEIMISVPLIEENFGFTDIDTNVSNNFKIENYNEEIEQKRNISFSLSEDGFESWLEVKRSFAAEKEMTDEEVFYELLKLKLQEYEQY